MASYFDDKRTRTRPRRVEIRNKYHVLLLTQLDHHLHSSLPFYHKNIEESHPYSTFTIKLQTDSNGIDYKLPLSITLMIH